MNGFENKTNDELLLLYDQTKRHDVKCELVLRYVNIVRSVAIQMRNAFLSFAEVDDIVNEGVLVLMTAVERYDPGLNIKFETYISKRIRGMIIDLARKNDWVPRNIRKKVKTIDNVTAQLYNEKGKLPTEEEIADKCELTVEQYRECMQQQSIFSILSLDYLMEDTENTVALQLKAKDHSSLPEDSILKNEMKKMLSFAIECLNEKEKLVISLYYAEELNMKDIARVLGVSEPRISQIHSKALVKLRESMKSYVKM